MKLNGNKTANNYLPLLPDFGFIHFPEHFFNVVSKMAALRKLSRVLLTKPILRNKPCIQNQTRLSSYFPIDDNMFGLTDEQKQVNVA
jgi:hypothetical protein